MSNLVRRNVDPFENALDRFFSGGFRSMLRDYPAGELERFDATLPVDVSETDKEYVVRASLPGFEKDKIDVEYHDDVLSIRGIHEEVKEDSDERYHIRERTSRSVSRQIRLPGGVDSEKVDAETKDGVLTVRIPKSVKAQPKKVKIK